MPDFPTLTRELVQRLERRVAPELTTPPAGAGPASPTVFQFGQTIASKARGGRPRNFVFCFGPRELGHLEEILALYAVDGLEPSFCFTPIGLTREVATALTAAGFAQREFQQAILYGLPAADVPPLAPGVSVERVTVDTVDDFVQTTAQGFEWPPMWGDAAMEGMRRDFRPEAYCYLARYDGEPAGAGRLEVRDGVGDLGGGAVLPQFRRKGCHLALLHHRLLVAHRLGCTLVVAAANFGSGSFRNQQRAGLRLAYIESVWSRE